MFSHITLFNLLTKDGAVQNTSVIVSTKDYFFLEMEEGAWIECSDLGGGMLGALCSTLLLHFCLPQVGASHCELYL